MKILLLADQAEPTLWEHLDKRKLEGVELVLSCGDLPASYLSFLTCFTPAPILYIHGNHDDRYASAPPEGCICIEDTIYTYKGIRILGLGGSMRYNKGINQYTEKQMRARVGRLRFKLWRSGGIDILLTHAPASGLNDGTDKAHKGFQVFNDLMDLYQPKWFIHGHMHLNYGANLPRVCTRGGTTVINATERYEFEIPDPVQVPKRKLFGLR